jgi:hypothetical protein
MIKFKDFILESKSGQEIIAYHSSPYDIDEFNFDDIEIGTQSSTRMEAIYFSNIPQHSWGKNLYKVKIITQNPIIWDMDNTRFDSLSVQEAFDLLLNNSTEWVENDLIDYQDMSKDEAFDLTEWWSEHADLLILKNCVYARHTIEYIVPSPKYNGHSAKIIILEKDIKDDKNTIMIDFREPKNKKDIVQSYVDEMKDFWKNFTSSNLDFSKLKDIVSRAEKDHITQEELSIAYKNTFK